MRAAAAVVLALLVSAQGIPVRAESLRGLWTAERSRWPIDKGGTATIVQLTVRRGGGKGHGNSSFPVPRTELEGLTDAILDAPSAEARFTWKRDAGTFVLEGRFQNGEGAGHFTFTPGADYRADMKRRGYGDVDDEKALSLAVHDVSRAFVDELAGLGYRQLSLDQLVALRIHGVTTDFIRRAQGRAGKSVGIDRLVSMRIHGEDPE